LYIYTRTRIPTRSPFTAAAFINVLLLLLLLLLLLVSYARLASLARPFTNEIAITVAVLCSSLSFKCY
jgi:hypothetical protein